jgi:transcriptional regulator with XRE-family HTH domain
VSASLLVAESLDRSRLSKAEFCRRTGVSRALLDDYLKGRKSPSADRLAALASVSGAELELTGPRAHSPELLRSAYLLEQVGAVAQALPARHPGPLRFPPFRTVVRP